MGIHELGIEHRNLCTSHFLYKKDTGQVFIHNFAFAVEHDCQRKYDVFLDAPAMNINDFGCDEIFGFIQNHVKLWTPGECYECLLSCMWPDCWLQHEGTILCWCENIISVMEVLHNQDLVRPLVFHRVQCRPTPDQAEAGSFIRSYISDNKIKMDAIKQSDVSEAEASERRVKALVPPGVVAKQKK